MFVDEAKLKIKAGDGGDGIIAFRREKYVPLGGPSGGNGGKGANIIFKVNTGLRTLLDFQNRKIIVGKKGENGKSSNMHGRHADDITLEVPPGTIVINTKTKDIICDLTKDKEEFIVARGGRGGKGNAAFSTHQNPAPYLSENGEPGEGFHIKMELKLIADVGLVGLPSVGKSTLISVISSAKPKIAEYEFTTLTPNLGVVAINDESFTVADLPGLIKGASKGIGLGDKFLKHIERTKVIVHVIDMSRDNPTEDYQIIEEELKLYSDLLKNKKRLIVANKMDMEQSKDNLEIFKKQNKDLKVYDISAIKKEGTKELVYAMKEELDSYVEVEENITTFKKYEYIEEKTWDIIKENNNYRITGLSKLYKMSNLEVDEGIAKFLKTLNSLGVTEGLRDMGIEDEDTVIIEDFEFTYRG